MRPRHKPQDLSPLARAVAFVSPSALLNNYHLIRGLAPEKFMLPMIKANAYGHGIDWAARLLVGLPGLYGLGVATLEEGADARRAVQGQRPRPKIYVFSGTAPWNDEKGEFCERFGLVPVIASEEDFRRFVRGKWPERLEYELKFNTGMNRLGIAPSYATEVARALKDKPRDWAPSGILSHLAEGDDPDSRLSQSQVDRFVSVHATLAPIFPAAQFHLSNSSGIWNLKKWGVGDLIDVIRPGLSLYGVRPFPAAPSRGLEPVMSFRAKVIAVHRLQAGDRVGYGGAFRVTEKDARPFFMATVSAGYGDGVPRSLGNQGQVWLNGKKERVLGRVSMDLMSVSARAETRVGDWAEILGEHIDPWEQARAAGTIPYELLTSVSQRVERYEST
jgi:alanine racemase